MPIGKNAIKRISNNGYSNVKTEAPDMENSEVRVDKAPIAKKKPQTKKASAAKSEPKPQAKKPAAKSAPKKTAPKKSMESEPSLAPVKTLEKLVEKKEDSKSYFNIGDKLPVYLL